MSTRVAAGFRNAIHDPQICNLVQGVQMCSVGTSDHELALGLDGRMTKNV